MKNPFGRRQADDQNMGGTASDERDRQVNHDLHEGDRDAHQKAVLDAVRDGDGRTEAYGHPEYGIF